MNGYDRTFFGIVIGLLIAVVLWVAYTLGEEHVLSLVQFVGKIAGIDFPE